jgi:hypothetical protein
MHHMEPGTFSYLRVAFVLLCQKQVVQAGHSMDRACMCWHLCCFLLLVVRLVEVVDLCSAVVPVHGIGVNRMDLRCSIAPVSVCICVLAEACLLD